MYHWKAELGVFFESFFNILRKLEVLWGSLLHIYSSALIIVNFNLIASNVNSFRGEEWVVYSRLGINFPYLQGRWLFVVGTYLRLRA